MGHKYCQQLPQFQDSPQLLQLPADLLIAVIDDLAALNLQQEEERTAAAQQLLSKRTGFASCKEWEQADASWVQVYDFFCNKGECKGHQLRRTTNWFEGKEKVHLRGRCCCNHRPMDQYVDFRAEKLPSCIAHLLLERIHVVDNPDSDQHVSVDEAEGPDSDLHVSCFSGQLMPGFSHTTRETTICMLAV